MIYTPASISKLNGLQNYTAYNIHQNYGKGKGKYHIKTAVIL